MEKVFCIHFFSIFLYLIYLLCTSTLFVNCTYDKELSHWFQKRSSKMHCCKIDEVEIGEINANIFRLHCNWYLAMHPKNNDIQIIQLHSRILGFEYNSNFKFWRKFFGKSSIGNQLRCITVNEWFSCTWRWHADWFH